MTPSKTYLKFQETRSKEDLDTLNGYLLRLQQISVILNGDTELSNEEENKDIIYIPGQDTWSEHFPTPGKLRPSNFGHMFCEPNSQFNKLLRLQNKLKSKRK